MVINSYNELIDWPSSDSSIWRQCLCFHVSCSWFIEWTVALNYKYLTMDTMLLIFIHILFFSLALSLFPSLSLSLSFSLFNLLTNNYHIFNYNMYNKDSSRIFWSIQCQLYTHTHTHTHTNTHIVTDWKEKETFKQYNGSQN